MTKTNYALMSLIAAVPAGVLAFYCIYAFISYSERMKVMMQVVNGFTLLLAVIVLLMPVVIMLKKGKPEVAAEGVGGASAVATGGAAVAADEIDADPFSLEEAGDDEAFDDDLPATAEEADLFEFDDEK